VRTRAKRKSDRRLGIFFGEPGALAPWGLTVSGERALSTGLNESPGCFSLPTVRLYALVESGDPKAIDVYLRASRTRSAPSRTAYGTSPNGAVASR
jgi:hypothetical protein